MNAVEARRKSHRLQMFSFTCSKNIFPWKIQGLLSFDSIHVQNFWAFKLTTKTDQFWNHIHHTAHVNVQVNCKKKVNISEIEVTLFYLCKINAFQRQCFLVSVDGFGQKSSWFFWNNSVFSVCFASNLVI